MTVWYTLRPLEGQGMFSKNFFGAFYGSDIRLCDTRPDGGGGHRGLGAETAGPAGGEGGKRPGAVPGRPGGYPPDQPEPALRGPAPAAPGHIPRPLL